MVQQKQPGLFAQMATTAAGVAVGSAVGHTIGAGISGMFGGGSSSHAPAPVPEAQVPMQQSQYSTNNNGMQVNACEADQKALMRCLESNANDMNACQFYMDMWKQCQSNSRAFV
ncbi:hypothetical protein HK102_011699 [Quaeritorhiza haematococci]|nr:hypothetical protein HK102_011699 [Quaeritorhiza haematococci]